jgi:hypothetical protein
MSLGIFFLATDGTMCLGVDSASKNEYQDTPGGKDGRCVRVMTKNLHSADSQENPEDLTYRNPLVHLGLSRDTFTIYYSLKAYRWSSTYF